jgi:2-dehydropantoate 2-reductase
MKIAIMGTGGLGGYIGGRLAHAGNEVSLIARGPQLEAIRQNGLQVKHAQGEFHIQPAQATDNPAEVGPVELILLSVKTYDLVPAVEAMRPMVGPQTAIIPVLNGIEHIEILSDMLGAEHVLGGQTSMTAHIVAPGVVERIGEHGVFEFGEMAGDLSSRVEAIEQVLGIEGLNGKAVSNIAESMWQKFAGICGVGVFSVVRGNAEILQRTPETLELIWQAILEGIAVAQAKDIPLDSSLLDWAKEVMNSLPPHFKPSMLVDLERDRRIEVEALNGAMSRLGKAVGVPTPVNDFIYACLKPYANGAA